MERCKCYEERLQTKYLTDFEQGIKFAYTGERITQVNEVVAHCLGTKECDTCTCGGDRSKCDFYPNVK